MRVLIAAVITAAIAQAQFSNLATTAEGSQVYVATTLRLKSEAQPHLPAMPAIYLVANGGVERMTTPPPPDLARPILQDNVQVSDDGNVWLFTQTQTCLGGSSCVGVPPATTSTLHVVKLLGGRSDTFDGAAQISRNGRFVLQIAAGQREDLQSGAVVQAPVRPAAAQQTVTNDGSVLALQGPGQDSALVLWNSPDSRTIATSAPPTSAIVNATGTWVVYEVSTNRGTDVHSVNIGTGADTLITTTSVLGSTEPSISDDGSLFLYRTAAGPDQPAQVWLARTGEAGGRQLTELPEGVDAAVLDGSGEAVIAATNGRLVRIDAQTGAVTELIGRTPVCLPGFITLTPGSILPIWGTGLSDVLQVAPTPLPFEMAGVRILVNGSPLPLLSLAPHEVWFQVPFDLALQPSVTVEYEHSSLFEGCPSVQVPAVARQPYFFSGTDGYLVLAHEDFGSVVSRAAPAQPNEIVHAYAVGLGAVAPPIQTGVPAPASPLHQLAEPFDCAIGFGDSTERLEVLFAGLAPGLIGTYQVDVRMPSTLPGGDFFLNCGTPGVVTERHGGEVPAP